MGWAARWRRTQAVGSTTRPARSPCGARPALSGARHAARTGRRAVAPAWRHLRRGPSCVREGVEGPVPPAPLQCPARPRPSPPGSGRVQCAPARRSGPRDSRRQGGQPGARPPRDRLGGQIPRARARDAARSTACARLRPAKLAQASGRRPRLRSAVVRGVVPRVANIDGGTAWTISGGSTSNMARMPRLAATWSHRHRRGAWPTIASLTWSGSDQTRVRNAASDMSPSPGEQLASAVILERRAEVPPAPRDPPTTPPRTPPPPPRARRA